MTPAILDHQLNGTDWDRLGNDDPDLSPHAIYPRGRRRRVGGGRRPRRRRLAGAGHGHRPAGPGGRRPTWPSARRPAGPARGDRRGHHRLDRRASARATPRRSSRRPAYPPTPCCTPARREDPQLAHLHHVVTVPHEGQPDRVDRADPHRAHPHATRARATSPPWASTPSTSCATCSATHPSGSPPSEPQERWAASRSAAGADRWTPRLSTSRWSSPAQGRSG